MPMQLDGSCRCGTVRFRLSSHTPHPYQLCYCTICRKTAGGGGYAINLGGRAETLDIEGREALAIYRAELVAEGEGGACTLQQSSAQRHFCSRCATALWLFDPTWPELIHPFASAIDSDLPVPPARVHLMLRYKANWVRPRIETDDDCYDGYPELSIDDWHRRQGLWVE